MHVLIAGATGVIGRQLVTSLLQQGHTISALARHPQQTDDLESSIRTVCADALDFGRLSAAISEATPDTIVNLLTAIPHQVNSRRVDREFAATNRLRTKGTQNLIAASKESGVHHHIAASLAYGYRPTPDGQLKTEDAPWWTDGPVRFRPVVDALKQLEERTTKAGGTVLRFGHLYGPGSAFARDGNFPAQIRKRMMPIVGQGNSVFSFVHANDAASAIVAALDPDRTTTRGGTYNIVDDDPAKVSDWLPEFARILGAKRPRRVPASVVRPLIGRYGEAYMNELVGADNSLAAQKLGWKPTIRSWREGFRAEFTSDAP